MAVMDWDNHRYFECFFGVPMLGAILHTVNVRLSPEQILYTINHAEDDVILVHADFVPIINQISDRFERPVKLIYLTDNAGNAEQLPEGFEVEYEAMMEAADPQFEFSDFDENTQATTFYTTGTTGDPKGVFFSHRQIVLHTLGATAGLASPESSTRLHRGDVYMPVTPMFHVHAWGFPYIATMLGLKQVYPGRYDPATLLKLVQQEAVTFTHCVPTILHMMLNHPDIDSVDLTGWKVLIGGSALAQGLATAAIERGIDVCSAYGMSETCPLLTFSDVPVADSLEETLAERCKTGNPTGMIELRVVDSEMNDVPRDGKSTGEVVARTPWLTQGYVKNPEGSAELWRGGYLHTGDVGYFDASGALQITDRMKDVIKSGGEWISSLELEDIASQCHGVGEVAAIGLSDERWGERPMLLVVRAGGDENPVSEQDVKSAIKAQIQSGQISKWAMPDKIEFVDQIDKTSVGKINKKVLRARYDQDNHNA